MAIEDLAQEEFRRRRGPAGGGASGYDGIGGAAAQPGMMLPFLTGARQVYDYSGPGQRQAQAFAGGGGNPEGPALRHFQRQGIDFPGFQNQNPVGGPNIAPGADNMQALQQSNLPANLVAQLAQAAGVPPGKVFQGGGGPNPPQTQGWRNYAPGYGGAAALGYGTDAFNKQFGLPGGYGGAGPRPTAGGGDGGFQSPGAGRFMGTALQGPGGGGGTVLRPGGQQNPIAGGASGFLGQAGGGPGSTSIGPGVGGKGGGGKGGGGGGGGGQNTNLGGAPGGVQTTAPVDLGPGGKPQINPNTGGVTSQGQPLLQGPTANGPSNQVWVPNNGNNNTPSEMGGGQPNKPPKPRRNKPASKQQR